MANSTPITPRTKVGRKRAPADIGAVLVRVRRGSRGQVVEDISAPDGTTPRASLHHPIDPARRGDARVMKPVARATDSAGLGATLARVTTLAPDKEPACPGTIDARRPFQNQHPRSEPDERPLAVRPIGFGDV